MCRCRHVSRSGHYAWGSRLPSKRERDDGRLLGRVREIGRHNSRGVIEAPVMHEGWTAKVKQQWSGLIGQRIGVLLKVMACSVSRIASGATGEGPANDLPMPGISRSAISWSVIRARSGSPTSPKSSHRRNISRRQRLPEIPPQTGAIGIIRDLYTPNLDRQATSDTWVSYVERAV